MLFMQKQRIILLQSGWSEKPSTKENTILDYLRKLMLHSVATALASNVFPVPGGPYSNIPDNYYYKHNTQKKLNILNVYFII